MVSLCYHNILRLACRDYRGHERHASQLNYVFFEGKRPPTLLGHGLATHAAHLELHLHKPKRNVITLLHFNTVKKFIVSHLRVVATYMLLCIPVV